MLVRPCRITNGPVRISKALPTREYVCNHNAIQMPDMRSYSDNVKLHPQGRTVKANPRLHRKWARSHRKASGWVHRSESMQRMQYTLQKSGGRISGRVFLNSSVARVGGQTQRPPLVRPNDHGFAGKPHAFAAKRPPTSAVCSRRGIPQWAAASP